MCQNPKTRMQPPSKNLQSRFCELLKSFLKHMREYNGDSLPMPPMLGDGKQVDLLKLFLTVRENGGYDAISKNKLWCFMADECGHNIRLGASVKLVYVKYLYALERWIERSVEDKTPLFGVTADESLMRSIDEIKVFLSSVPNSKELECKLNLIATDGMEFAGSEVQNVHLDPYHSKQNGVNVTNDFTKLNSVVGLKRMDSSANGDKTHKDADKNLIIDWTASLETNRDKGKICSDSNAKGVTVLSLDSSAELSSGSKRKRQSMSRMLEWITGVARNPCDSLVVELPEPSMWRSHGNEEIWKQVLLAREKLFLKRIANQNTKQFSCQKTQKMNPSKDDDHDGLYNLRERSKCTKKPQHGKTLHPVVPQPCSSVDQTQARPFIGRVGNGESYRTPGIDIPTKISVPRGPRFQAEVPEWSGIIVESDPKWMGTRMWPLEKEGNEWDIENQEIGKGRQDSCGCPEPKSTECVRLHIGERKLQLENELGTVFEHWQLDMTGEVVALVWTNEDRKKVQTVVSSYKNYWDEIVKAFPNKKVKDLVNYLFNVVLLQKRAHQNRFAPENVYTDSDDDDNETNKAPAKSRTTVIRSLYSPKKR